MARLGQRNRRFRTKYRGRGESVSSDERYPASRHVGPLTRNALIEYCELTSSIRQRIRTTAPTGTRGQWREPVQRSGYELRRDPPCDELRDTRTRVSSQRTMRSLPSIRMVG